ncbi:hypothetical protein FACS1894188_01850 [Clostridia bacterium]|nr:hypothetical protein FACS1894188_01850 [Clostridia bacterium]
MRKRIISFALSVIMIAGLLPAQVFANPQEQISYALVLNETITDTNYSFTLLWDRPSQNMNGPDLDDVLFFDVESKNQTRAGSDLPRDPNLPVVTSTPQLAQEKHYTNVAMAPGSIYSFTPTPWHTHTVTNPDGTSTVTPIRPLTPTPFALYLSDIEVSATGSITTNDAGAQVYTVTAVWDKPTYGDAKYAPIAEYKIYMGNDKDESGNTIPINDNDPQNNVATVRKDTEGLESFVENSIEKYRYTFTTTNFQANRINALKIVPQYNKTTVNTVSGLDAVRLSDNPSAPLVQMNHTNREYRCAILPVLEITARKYGADKVIIDWSNLQLLSNETFAAPKLKYVEVYEIAANGTKTRLGTLGGKAAGDTPFWITNLPDSPKSYSIRIGYTESDTSTELKWVESSPAALQLTEDLYLPYIPTIYELKQIGEAKPFSVDMRWLAFLRAPFNTLTEPVDDDYGGYIDTDITYDIWVSDDVDYFYEPSFDNTMVVRGLSATELNVEPYIEGTDTVRPSYVYNLNQYYTKVGVNEYAAVSGFTPNKTYYFKIRAKRKDDDKLKSYDAMGSIYIKPDGEISDRPVMISAPPLRIKKDADGMQEITSKTITVEWDTRYVEVYNAEDNRWYSYVNFKDGKLVFDDRSKPNLLEGINPDLDLDTVYANVAAKFPGVTGVISRVQDLSRAKFKLYTAADASINAAYDTFVKQDLLDASAAWRDIDPEIVSAGAKKKTMWYTVDVSENPGGELEPNTPYVIFLLPYFENQKDSYFPAYTAATTLDERGDLDIDPTSPMIEIITEKTTDTEITVRFTYNEVLEYELYGSELISDYPDGAFSFTWEELQETGTIVTDTNPLTKRPEKYFQFTVDLLFPETSYYFWARAISPTNGKEKNSNPATETTKPMVSPEYPRGFGPASAATLDIYNKSNNLKLTPTDPEYLIFEWMRDPKDTAPYPAEVSAEGAKALLNDLLDPFFMAQFTPLEANKTYYARAKTVLTLTKGETGRGSSAAYSYVVQLSEDAYFTDFTEITIPPLVPDEADDISTKRRESDWTNTIYLFTDKSGTEYDAKENPKHYPLPDKDFEILYENGKVIYRFRSDKKDARGNNDNQVDQRFISNLVHDPVFTYDVDLSSYKNYDTKEIVLPYTIISAFDERNISLRLISDGGFAATLSPKSFATPEVSALKDYGKGSFINFTVTKDVSVPKLENAQSYAAYPQKVGIQLVTPTRKLSLSQTSVPLSVELSIGSKETNRGAYVSGKNTAGWSRLDADYDEIENKLTASSKLLETFGAISRQGVATSNPETTAALQTVTSKIDITDIAGISANAPISGQHFNALLLAVARNRNSVTLNAPVSQADMSSLQKAGIAVSPSAAVSGTQGVGALIKLYETKAGKVDAVDKAGALGVSVPATMTYADTLKFLDMIIQDAGI